MQGRACGISASTVRAELDRYKTALESRLIGL